MAMANTYSLLSEWHNSNDLLWLTEHECYFPQRGLIYPVRLTGGKLTSVGTIQLNPRVLFFKFPPHTSPFRKAIILHHNTPCVSGMSLPEKEHSFKLSGQVGVKQIIPSKEISSKCNENVKFQMIKGTY